MRGFGIIFLAIALSVTVGDLKGQTTSASVGISIVLNPILNLTINPEQSITTLTYSTLADYRDGVEVTNKEHLTVFSTGPYVVNARLIGEEYVKVSGETDKKMYLPDVRIAAIPLVGNGAIKLENTVLTAENSGFIVGATPALNEVFDVSFHGPGGGAFADYVSKQKSSSFTNTVIYSLEIR